MAKDWQAAGTTHSYCHLLNCWAVYLSQSPDAGRRVTLPSLEEQGTGMADAFAFPAKFKVV